MIDNKQIIFKKDPGAGWVDDKEHMELVTSENGALLEGQVLLKNIYLSVDPYMRGRMNTKAKSYTAHFELGKVMTGGGISQVIKSRREGFEAGDIVSGMIGWEEFTVISSDSYLQKIINPTNAPLEYFLGILGMPGATAYYGLLDIGQPKKGDTVFVSGAAGAVGLVVGQIAKLKGCKVVGSAGSDDKVATLLDQFGYDAAFNYKTVQSLPETLRKLCPNGIDIYFDNVGGETLDAALLVMNTHGRLVECGMISQYNASTPYALKNTMLIVGKQLKMEGFIISNQLGDQSFMNRFVGDISGWIKEGKLKYAVHVAHSIDQAPSAFVNMLKGANTGKQIVQIAKL